MHALTSMQHAMKQYQIGESHDLVQNLIVLDPHFEAGQWARVFLDEGHMGVIASLVSSSALSSKCSRYVGLLPCINLFAHTCNRSRIHQLAPDKEIIIEYIKNEDFKYVRLLGEIALCIYRRLLPLPSIEADA